jgi:sialate O-acetylesterase
MAWFGIEKLIDVPASMTGMPAKVFLGRNCRCRYFIHQRKTGLATQRYQYPQRRYNVPAGLLKAGKNIFVIRVTNTRAKEALFLANLLLICW